MKRTTILLLTLGLLIVQGSTALRAQSVTDAFYIYQNDGHFDGFFYDEVQCIQYSKTDTLGVEHTDYVSQEIVTADSTYRFMLTAIDSVGFVQPEIKIARIHDLQADGLENYLAGIDGQRVFFHGLGSVGFGLFHVGEIIVHNSTYFPEQNFSGKITSVTEDDWEVMIEFEQITDAKDVFKQFTTIEQYNATETGQLLSRRVAGLPELGLGRYAPPSVVRQAHRAGSWTYDLLNFNFSGTIPLYGNGYSISLIPSIEGKVNIKAAWDMPRYMSFTTTMYYGVGIGLEVEGQIEGELNPPASGLLAIPLPAAAPIFQLELLPNLFIKGSLSAKLALQSPKYRGKAWVKFKIEDYLPSFDFGASPSNKVEDQKDEEYYAQPNDFSAQLSAVGEAQLGVKFPLNLKSSSLLSYVFSCGIGAFAYVGPKATASFSIDLANVVSGDNTFYNNFKDSKVSISPISFDFVAEGHYSKFWSGDNAIEYNTSLTPFDDIDFHILPEFDAWHEVEKTGGVNDYDYEGKTFNALAIKPPKWSWTPWKVELGISKYRIGIDDEEIDAMDGASADSWATKPYWASDIEWVSDAHWPLYTNLDALENNPGIYRFYPVFKFFNKTIRVPKPYDYVTKAPYLIVKSDTLWYEPEGGTKSFKIKTNIQEPLEITLPPCAEGGSYEQKGDLVSVTLPKMKGVLYHYNFVYVSSGKGDYHSVPVVRKPTGEISKIGVFDHYFDVNTQLGFTPSEHFTFTYSAPNWDGIQGQKVDIDVDLILDTSRPDSIMPYGGRHFTHIKSGHIKMVTSYEWETEEWDDITEQSVIVKNKRVETKIATVTKPWYGGAYGNENGFSGFYDNTEWSVIVETFKNGKLIKTEDKTNDYSWGAYIYFNTPSQ